MAISKGCRVYESNRHSPESRQPEQSMDTEFISVLWEPGFGNNVLLEGPTLITKGWKSLKMAGFEGVGAFVPNAQFPDQPWVFSGDQCARISISADTILSGPFLIPENWTEDPLD